MPDTFVLDKLYLPYEVMVASDQDATSRRVFKYGSSDAVGTTAETVWDLGGAYTWPSAAATLELTSANANDADAGTGARTVLIQGLDADYAEQEETVTLNGQTAVTTTGSYLRLHRMYVVTPGSGGTNEGTIYAANSSGTHTAGVPTDLTLVYSTIGGGEGQTLQAFYTVPANHTAYMTSTDFYSYDNNNVTTMVLRHRPFGGAWRTAQKVVAFQSAVHQKYDLPLKFTEKTDIEVRGTAGGGTVPITADFNLILLDNSQFA